MFNIGTGEIALIAVAALLLLGPKRLPELARGIGKFMREFRRQTDDIRNTVEREFYKMDQELSINESPEAPLIRPAAAAEPHGLPPAPAPVALPLPTDPASQLTAGTPATTPVAAPGAAASEPMTAAPTDPSKPVA
jgi:sec-independent protein translocase protein TatB